MSDSYISVTAPVFGQLSHAASLGIFWSLYTYVAVKIKSIICRTMPFTPFNSMDFKTTW